MGNVTPIDSASCYLQCQGCLGSFEQASASTRRDGSADERVSCSKNSTRESYAMKFSDTILGWVSVGNDGSQSDWRF